MELHQLRYAVAVADEGSFTAAARALHVSQSGVSAQVARLERELGLPLFDRGSRVAAPTTAGQALLSRMRTALAAVDDIELTASQLLGLLRGRVRIGAVAGMVWPAFLDALQAVRGRHPGLELSLSEGQSLEVQQQVLDGRLDTAVVSWVGEPLAPLASWVAVREELRVVVSRTHPWAKRRRIRPDELAEAGVICMTQGTGMRAAYDAMMRAEGLPAAAAWEVTLPSTVRSLAARGLGVGLLTSSRADPPGDLVSLPLLSRHTGSALGVVWRDRPPPTPGTEAVLTSLREHLGAEMP